jgi:hypothetical protein
MPIGNQGGTGAAKRFGGGLDVGGGVVGGSPLAYVARLAAAQPRLSRAEFGKLLSEAGISHEGGFGGNVHDNLFQTFRQLTSASGDVPTSPEEVTAPEPEGPGRFQATRPAELLKPGAPLRFGA